MRRVLLFSLLVMSLMLNGCGNGDKTDVDVKSGGENKSESKFVYPKYDKEVIITDLVNADMEFYYGQYNCICDFRIISTMPLEKENLNIEFDSDIKVEYDIEEDVTEDATFFDYNLLLAYNGLKSENGMSYVDELPKEEYDEISEKVPELYSYFVAAYFETSDVETGKITKYQDAIINKMTITYNNEEYSYNIGEIKINENINVEQDYYEDDYVAQTGSSHIMDTLYYNTDNEFMVSATRLFESLDTPVKIVNAEFINGSTYLFSHLEVIMTNEQNSTESIWRQGDELIIPPNTEVAVNAVGVSENIKNNIGFKVAPILKVEIETNEKICQLYYEFTGAIYGFTKYEIYAYSVDAVDIFTSYYDVKSEVQ